MSEAEGFWKRKWKWVAGCAAVAVVLIIAGGHLASPEPRIPTATVIRGPFQDFLELRGEVKAFRSVSLTAPRRAGQLMIVKLATDGSPVRKGDVVVQFDSSALEQQLLEHKSALESARAVVQQAEAQARLTEQQDLTNVMNDRYALQSAQLDASKQAILSKIDGEEADIKVTDAQLALKQAEEQLKMDKAADAATLADDKEKQNKAAYDVRQDETVLSRMALRAPIPGIVTILKHYTPNGRELYRLGDQVWSGADIAELPDLSTLYFDARADEIDRSRLKTGQTALVRAAAIPGQDFPSRIQLISTIASTDFSAPYPFPRDFEIQIAFNRQVAKLRPGMSATARVLVGQIPDALQIPTQAVFQSNGRPIAYVFRKSKFNPSPIQLGHRGNGMVIVTAGLKAGDRVAIQSPVGKE